ncbi:MAG: sarcosine oxidase subunit delta, partial [Rhizobiales bacterium 24-66-13]
MLLIPCPYCGARPEIEFHCGGEAHIARPADPSALSDAEWAEYLFIRKSPKGV